MVVELLPSLLRQEIPRPESLESPLPGGLAALVRFFLDFPQPLQIAGVVLGIGIAAALGFVAWRRRAGIWSWLRTRPRIVYAGAAGAGVLLLFAGVVVGLQGWNYVQHDNGFCTGCHIMGPSFVRFAESEHSQLECHDCHEQPVMASMRQLYLWVMLRPEEIGPHAPVATEVCARCHIQEDPSDSWEAIVSTQGHAVHLESDSTALDGVQCVTCHAAEVHRFIPAEETCAQSGCHRVEDTQIALGAMTGAQTTLHCVGCHQFTAPLEASAGRPLVPALDACSGCHAMEPLIEEFASASDPHEAVCGMCHNPHAQGEPVTAFESCTSAGCHEDPELLTPFHRGIEHETAEDCAACHTAHQWIVDGDDCAACHTNMRE